MKDLVQHYSLHKHSPVTQERNAIATTIGHNSVSQQLYLLVPQICFSTGSEF